MRADEEIFPHKSIARDVRNTLKEVRFAEHQGKMHLKNNQNSLGSKELEERYGFNFLMHLVFCFFIFFVILAHPIADFLFIFVVAMFLIYLFILPI